MAKPTTIKIRLNSTADTGHFYVTKKNARTMTEKMTVRKYDPVARKLVESKEGKIKEDRFQTNETGRASARPLSFHGGNAETVRRTRRVCSVPETSLIRVKELCRGLIGSE